MSELLDRARVLALLAELGQRLDARGVTVEIYVVGGTAMTLAYDRMRLTRDIDATWDSAVGLEDEVAQMSARHGLPRNWLNDGVRLWRPSGTRPDVL